MFETSAYSETPGKSNACGLGFKKTSEVVFLVYRINPIKRPGRGWGGARHFAKGWCVRVKLAVNQSLPKIPKIVIKWWIYF